MIESSEERQREKEIVVQEGDLCLRSVNAMREEEKKKPDRKHQLDERKYCLMERPSPF